MRGILVELILFKCIVLLKKGSLLGKKKQILENKVQLDLYKITEKKNYSTVNFILFYYIFNKTIDTK